MTFLDAIARLLHLADASAADPTTDPVEARRQADAAAALREAVAARQARDAAEARQVADARRDTADQLTRAIRRNNGSWFPGDAL